MGFEERNEQLTGSSHVYGVPRSETCGRLEEELKTRLRQQVAIAELGQQALAAFDVPALMDQAVRSVAECLEVEYSKILQLLPDGQTLLLRAGVGWQPGLVGQATVGTEVTSQAGYTLLSHEPVIVSDLREETRFSGPALLHEHGVISGLSVIIQGKDRPFGVLGAHTARRRTFTQDDIRFLQAMANTLAQAIQRQHSEEAMREANDRLQAIVQASPVALVTQDCNGVVQSWNPAAERIFGWTEQEALGHRLPTVPADERGGYLADLQRILRGEHLASHEIHAQRRDGALIDILASTAPLHDTGGRIRGFVAALADITKRKRAEQALRESERKIHSVVEHSADGIAFTDEQGRVVEWNRRQEEITGLKREEVLGRPIWDVQFQLAPDDKRTLEVYQRARAAALEMLETGQSTSSIWPAEQAMVRPDGQRRIVQTAATPIKTHRGFIISSTVHDVTERRLAEERLRESEDKFRRVFHTIVEGIVLIDPASGVVQEVNEGLLSFFGCDREEILGRPVWELEIWPDEEMPSCLERLLDGEPLADAEISCRIKDGSVRTVLLSTQTIEISGRPMLLCIGRDITDYKRLLQQLQQARKMETIGRLAGGVAHDFNNLLTAITGFTSFALQSLPPGSQAREDLGQVLKAAHRASDLTRQLLAFSRRQATVPEAVNLNDLILDTEKMLRRLIGEHIELSIVAAPELGLVRADPTQLQQVLINLVVNARDAMPEGGTLVIETAPLSLNDGDVCRSLGISAGDYVSLTVRDTGLGMSEQVRERIFEPLFTTKAPGEGTGLGLTVVYDAVQQNQGCITVESVPGQGTVFTVYLPGVKEAPAHTRAAREESNPPYGRETVLVVEDEPALRALVTRTLRRLGYQVLEAADGADALQQVQNKPGEIHLLLTDVVMPKMNGGALAEQLTARYPALKVLYMSGYADDRVAQQRVAGRSSAFLQKPFSMPALGSKVRQVLDESEGIAQ